MEKQNDFVANARIGLAEFTALVLGVDPYDWQIHALDDIQFYKKTSIVAANGSGKTAAVAAPTLLWWLACFPKGRVVITSGSFRQLKDQFWPAVTRYRQHPLFARWKINKLNIETDEEGLTSIFSTDDPGKAEGYHQAPDAPLLYIIDEAKSVPDEIFEAMRRCTTTRVLYMSSPGKPSGEFYDSHHKDAESFRIHKVTSEMCPHIDPVKRAEDIRRYTIDHPLVRSMHFAEWTARDASLCLSPEALSRALASPPPFRDNGRSGAAIDFAAGRDENAIATARGNKIRLELAWCDKDTVQTVYRVQRELTALNISPYDSWGDADGLGLHMVNHAIELGCHINPFHGGAKANEEMYLNLISEIWIEGGIAIARGDVILENIDPVTFEQLTTRHIEFSGEGKMRIESKDKLKKSPDRGDVVMMAIWLARVPRGVWTDKSGGEPLPDEDSQVENTDAQDWGGI